MTALLGSIGDQAPARPRRVRKRVNHFVFHFSVKPFFGEILLVAGNKTSTEISLNFAISERRGNLNLKNKIPMYTGKISVISAEIWCPEGEIRCL